MITIYNEGLYSATIVREYSRDVRVVFPYSPAIVIDVRPNNNNMKNFIAHWIMMSRIPEPWIADKLTCLQFT